MPRKVSLLETINDYRQTKQAADRVNTQYRHYINEVAPRQLHELQTSLRQQMNALEEQRIDTAISCLERLEADYQRSRENSHIPESVAKKLHEDNVKAQMAVMATILPKDCPTTLEALRAYKIKRAQDAQAAQQAEQRKLEQQRLENEKIHAIQERKNQKNTLITNNKYGRWHFLIGMIFTLIASMLILPSLGYLPLFTLSLIGGFIGFYHQNAVNNSAKSYLIKEDIDQITGDDQRAKLEALQYGIEAQSWKGYLETYYDSHKRSVTFSYGKEFSAGLIQGLANNEEVINAVRRRLG